MNYIEDKWNLRCIYCIIKFKYYKDFFLKSKVKGYIIILFLNGGDIDCIIENSLKKLVDYVIMNFF